MEAIAVKKQTGIININLNSYVSQFLLSQDVKASSKATYQRALRQFTTWITQESITDPIREDILRYKDYLRIQGLSALTVSNYLVSVRRFFAWTESIKLYPDITRGIKGVKKSRGFRKDPLTIGQIKELLNAIDQTTTQGLRDYALLNLMVRTGLREIEVIRADIQDMRQEGGEALLYIQGKGREAKDEFVLLTQETLKPIYAYLQARGGVGDTEPLFASLSNKNKDQRLTTKSVSRIAKTCLRGIGLNNGRLSAHSLRHTFATIALKNGAPIMQVKEAMRHSNIETTMNYTHVLDRVSNGAERYINF